MTLRVLLPAALAVAACGERVAPSSTSNGHGAEGEAGASSEQTAGAENTAGTSSSTPDSTTGEASGEGTSVFSDEDCSWRRLDVDEFCIESPCAITDVLRLECENGLYTTSLRADDERVRVGFRTGGRYALFELSSGDVEPVEVPALPGEVATRLASPAAIVHAVEDRFTLSLQQADGSWSSRDLPLVGGSAVDARVLDNGELRLAFNQPGMFDAAPAREVDRWDGGSAIVIDGISGSSALTSRGTLVSPRYYSTLEASLWTETTTEGFRLLPNSVSNGTAVASGEAGELVFVSAAPSALPSGPPLQRLDVLSNEERLLPLGSRQPLGAEACVGSSQAEICPTEVETHDLGSEFGFPRSLTTSQGSWVAVTTRFGNATCGWHPVTCTSSGLCSHGRGCERGGSLTYSTSVDVYATDRPGAASLHIPPRFGAQPQLTAASLGDTLYLSLHGGGTLHIVKVDAALLPRGATEPTEELPVLPETTASPVVITGDTAEPTPCDESLRFADPEGDAIEVTLVSQIHAPELISSTVRAGAPEQGLVLLTTATGDFVAGDNRLELGEDRWEVVTRIAANGPIAWVAPRVGATDVALTPDGDTIVVGGPTQANDLARDAPHVALLGVDGEPTWERFYGPTVEPLLRVAVLSDGRIVAASGGARPLFALDAEGSPRARQDLPFPAVVLMTTSDDRVVIVSSASQAVEWGGGTIAVDDVSNLVAVMDASLEPLWATVLPERIRWYRVMEDGSIWTHDGTSLRRVDSSGTEVVSFPGFDTYQVVTALPDGTLLVAGYEGDLARLARYDEAGTELSSTRFGQEAFGNGLTLFPVGANEVLAVIVAACGDREAVTVWRLDVGPL